MSSKNLRSPVTSTATLSLQPKSEPHELIDQLNTSSISSSTSHTSNFKKTGKKMNVAHANETKNKSKGESEDELLLEEVTKSSENTLNKTKRSPSNSSPSPNSTPKSSSTSSSSLSLSPNSKSSPSHTHSNSNFHSHSHSHSHFSRLCRNVTIYGFCKNETKGCKFFHPTSKLNHSPPFSAFPITSENASSSSTTHATTLPSTVVSSTNEFLPSATHLPFSGTLHPSSSSSSTPHPKPFFPLAASHRSLTPSPPFLSKTQPSMHTHSTSNHPSPNSTTRLQKSSPSPSPPCSPPQKLRIESPSFHPHHSTHSTPSSTSSMFSTHTALGLMGGPPSSSLNTILPALSMSPSSSPTPLMDAKITQAPSTFLPSTSLIHPVSPTAITSPHSQLNFPLDPHIQIHTFVQWAALEPSAEASQAFGGYICQWYKAMNVQDGIVHAVLRLKGFKVSNVSMLSKVVDKWKGIRDPGIVRLHEAFTSTLLDQEPSLFLVYDYHPQARSLSSLTSSPHSSHALSPFFQLASTLLRYPTVYLHPTKILVQAPFYRINAVGVADFLALPIPSPSQQLCAVLANVHGCQRVCQQLRAGGSVKDVIAHHAHGLLDELEHWRRNQDVLDWELRKSKENDRLARLLIKLNFITERPEYLQDPSWSETGDRYFLKLFRDYVFHMVDEEGRPSLDLGHVIASLNKLDAGVPDQVVLTSRDDRNYLIVSYAELKKYMDAAFMELLEASQSPISPTSSHS